MSWFSGFCGPAFSIRNRSAFVSLPRLLLLCGSKIHGYHEIHGGFHGGRTLAGSRQLPHIFVNILCSRLMGLVLGRIYPIHSKVIEEYIEKREPARHPRGTAGKFFGYRRKFP